MRDITDAIDAPSWLTQGVFDGIWKAHRERCQHAAVFVAEGGSPGPGTAWQVHAGYWRTGTADLPAEERWARRAATLGAHRTTLIVPVRMAEEDGVERFSSPYLATFGEPYLLIVSISFLDGLDIARCQVDGTTAQIGWLRSRIRISDRLPGWHLLQQVLRETDTPAPVPPALTRAFPQVSAPSRCHRA